MRKVPLLLPLLIAVPACASDADAVDVKAGNHECAPAKTSFDAGKLTFKVHNTGSKVTELYVYAPGDKVMGEVENVGPGTARTLTVTVPKGTYELACKPGQTGRGIRTAIEVSGEGGESAKPSRQIAVEAVDYSYAVPSSINGITAGETVEFELRNTGTHEHEFEVLDGDGRSVGEVGETQPGQTGEGDVTFSKPGTYTFRCALEDHEQRGMKGTFTVK